MKLLFFNPEQYLDFEREPSNYELRLPILNCGIVTSYRDYIYQRVLRSEGRDAMNRRTLQEVREFRPDLVVYSTSWPHESIDSWVLQAIMRRGIPVLTHVWDTHIEPQPHEIDWFNSCNYFAIADSLTNYRRYQILAKNSSKNREVLFTAGNLVFTDIIQKTDCSKQYDVSVIGSNEGQRVHLIQYLKKELAKHSISIQKFGGLVDSTKGQAVQGLTDRWIPMEKYVDFINESKICISSQTVQARNQIKGKVFHYLACGSLCMSDSNSDLKELIPENCIVYYDSFEDCLNKILYYSTNEEEQKRIAREGYEWFHKTYNYKIFWSETLQEIVEKNCHNKPINIAYKNNSVLKNNFYNKELYFQVMENITHITYRIKPKIKQILQNIKINIKASLKKVINVKR